MAENGPAEAMESLNRRIVACERCPRLAAYIREVAQRKRASFRDWTYWGRPVPNFGDPAGRLLIVGLAPAAHGANRTGRMFTGDRSGDFLFARLHETGFANQADATDRDDGLVLHDALITAAVHCAPPQNKPRVEEQRNCAVHLRETFDAMPNLRVILALGRLGHEAVLRLGRERGWVRRLSDRPFEHGGEHDLSPGPRVLMCYHPSQQNTFTGRLTAAMMRRVLRSARRRIKAAPK